MAVGFCKVKPYVILSFWSIIIRRMTLHLQFRMSGFKKSMRLLLLG